jgi:predicted metal-dependent hydrolase
LLDDCKNINSDMKPKITAAKPKPNIKKTGSPVTPAPKSTKDKTGEIMKTFALETLKKIVEKYPNKFPKLAKMFGIKLKSK